MTGIILIIVFGIGHCLPIVICRQFHRPGEKLLESSAWSGAGMWFRKLAGATIMLLGLYFIAQSLFSALQPL